MELSYARQIIQSMSKIGARHCTLIGGEPTLYRQLKPILEICTESKTKTVMISNGRKLKSQNFLNSLQSAGLKQIAVSIEGAIAKTHNLITGRSSFNETISGIKNSLAQKMLSNTITTISKLNQGEIFEVACLLHDLGVEDILYNLALPAISGSKIDIDNVLEPSQYAEIISATYLQAKAVKIKVKFITTIPLCLFQESLLKNMMHDKALNIGCHMYHGQRLVFSPNGDILPCTHYTDFPLLNARSADGNFLYHDNFLTVWEPEDSVANKFRKKIWRYPSKNCNGCKYWSYCIGGCPLFWTSFDPRRFIGKKFA